MRYHSTVIVRCFALVLGFASVVRAVAPQSPTQLVIHLWVDPHYGDDALASGSGSMNPNGVNTIVMATGCFTANCPCGGGSTPCCRPVGLRPNDIVDPSGNTLLHAPYPFRTITAAVAYINAIPGLTGAPSGTPPLPYTSSTTGKTWKRAIIHLLPGLYSAALPPGYNNHHPDNGLVPNGETFPILLPPGVSVQGASALNTFFDLRASVGFLFGVFMDPATGQRVAPGVATAVPVSGEDAYIARIMFYGAGPDPQTGAMPLGTTQGAVVVDDEVSSAPTITNCVFFRNKIGVLVNAAPGSGGGSTEPPSGAARHDGLTIVNNTFVWNTIGIWNGQLADTPLTNPGGQVVFGWSKLNVINNVFDRTAPGESGTPFVNHVCGWAAPWPANPWTWIGPTPPSNPAVAWPWPTGMANNPSNSAFAGLCAEDMRTVISLNGQSIAEDFNAYERLDGPPLMEPYNISTAYIAIPQLIPAVARPGTSNPVPHLTREIHAFTGFQNFVSATGTRDNAARGILFVRDLICSGQSVVPTKYFPPATGQPPGVPTGFDGSRHDFRLSPTAATSADQAVAAPNALNPLVDNGYGGGWPATMANGQSVEKPGRLDLDASVWPFSAMEFDMEGWGNPRVFDHPTYPGIAPRLTELPVAPEAWEMIDIGADELGDLIVAGYRWGTTDFVTLQVGDPANGIFANAVQSGAANEWQWYLGPVTFNPPPGLPVATLAASFLREQPFFRSFDSASGTWPVFADWPQTYATDAPGVLGVDNGVTWISTESDVQPVIFPRPWRFPPPAAAAAPACAGGACPGGVLTASWHDVYHATNADVTPHLIPDLHPWWSQMTASVTGGIGNFVPASLVFWQPCLGSGLFNQALYSWFTPGSFPRSTASAINPPGTLQGGMAAVGSFDWLDTTLYSAQGLPTANFVRFRQWHTRTRPPGTLPLPLRIDRFDEWCRGLDSSAPQPQFPIEHRMPSTRIVPLQGGNAVPIRIRFSLEFATSGCFSTTGKNLQSFTALIDRGQ